MTMESKEAAPYVFLSYASADRERALHLADLLETSGVPVWMDRKSITGGTSWSAEIVRGIRGCTVFAVVCSPPAVASPNVQQEIQLAFESRRPILPLVLEQSELPEAVAYALAGRQWIEVLDRSDEVWLALALRALVNLGIGRHSDEGPSAFPLPDQSSSARTAETSASVGPSPPTPSEKEAILPPRHNLPAPVTSFVGRVKELTEIRRLLQRTRLLTLTGAGGCGKTRLALQLARKVLDDYSDGVWLVELAALTDETLVSQTVLTALGLRTVPGQSVLETLSDYLHARQVLLVMDNCEHLIGASAQLVAILLRTTPKLKVLATSRELLGMAGEMAWSVPSLGLPNPGHVPPVEVLRDVEAVRLFVDRAAVVQPGFAVTYQNAAPIAQVCLRLDGIPLAIELAAARLRGLSVEQIAARLDDRFRLLTGGSRTALRRQQTLRATVDWSYDLLTDAERMALRRLSVFLGGWSLEAAESVCADDRLDSADVLNLLLQLVDKSLVLADAETQTARYRLLEMIRQYAGEKLLEAGEAPAVRNRHCDWFVALVERTGRFIFFRDSRDDLAELDRERDNVRAALGWAVKRGNAEAALRMVMALPYYWVVRGSLTEGSDWAANALALTSPSDRTIARADALNAAALVAYYQADPAGQKWNEEALGISRQHRHSPGIWFALQNLAALARDRGDLTEAQAYNEEGLAVARAVGDRDGAWAHIHNLGYLALERNEYSTAQGFFEESLSFLPNVPTIGRARALWGLAQVALGLDNFGEARDFLARSLRLHLELGDVVGVGIVLTGFARLALAEGNPVRALRLAAAQKTHRTALGAAYGRPTDTWLERVQNAVGAPDAETAWVEGQAMTLEQAIAVALEEDSG